MGGKHGRGTEEAWEGAASHNCSQTQVAMSPGGSGWEPTGGFREWRGFPTENGQPSEKMGLSGLSIDKTINTN